MSYESGVRVKIQGLLAFGDMMPSRTRVRYSVNFKDVRSIGVVGRAEVASKFRHSSSRAVNGVLRLGRRVVGKPSICLIFSSSMADTRTWLRQRGSGRQVDLGSTLSLLSNH